MDMSDDDFFASTSPSMSSTGIDVKSTRTVGLWEAFIYRHRVLLHHSHGLPYMIPPYPYPYYTYTSTSYMNSLALTWSKYGPRRPPKDKVAARAVSMAALFAGHQIDKISSYQKKAGILSKIMFFVETKGTSAIGNSVIQNVIQKKVEEQKSNYV